jgi:nitrate/nitrite-specific signal transduction histidine kinase
VPTKSPSITAFISENIADIYQELRDLCSTFQIDDEAVQNDALLAFVEAFEQHWGQKLLNVLRPLHVLSMMKESDLYD